MADPISAEPEEIRAPSGAPPAGALTLLRRPQFRRLYLAVVTSELGDAFQYIALMWAALLAGWGILRLLAIIPVAGGLVGLVATVVGLGALTVALWQARTPSPPRAPAPGRPAVAA